MSVPFFSRSLIIILASDDCAPIWQLIPSPLPIVQDEMEGGQGNRTNSHGQMGHDLGKDELTGRHESFF